MARPFRFPRAYTLFERLASLWERLHSLRPVSRTGRPPSTRLCVEMMEDRTVPNGAWVGLIWNDANNNLFQDAGEPGIAGVLIEAGSDSSFSTQLSTTSGSDGTFRLEDIPTDWMNGRASLPAGSGYNFYWPNSGTTTILVPITISNTTEFQSNIPAYASSPPPPPSLSIGNVSQAEGNSGQTAFNFPVTLSSSSTQTVTVSYMTSDGTATAGSDYTMASGTLTFIPGQTSQTITVQVTGDIADELDETLTVTLSNPINATLMGSMASGTILNDDGTSPPPPPPPPPP